MSDARKKLAAAIRLREAADEALRDATTALDGALRFVGDIEARVAAFAEVDAKVAAERAAEVKAAVTQGRVPDFSPSRDLAEALAAKVEAENEITAARSAVRELDREAGEARAALDRRRDEVARAVEAVVVEVAAEFTEKIEALEVEALRLRTELNGAAMLFRTEAGRRVEMNLGPKAFEIIRQNGETKIGVQNTPAWLAAAAFRHRWLDFVGSLEVDATANL